MKKLSILFFALFAFCLNVTSQIKTESVLIEIEKNNTWLLALRESSEAEVAGNKTGIFLSDPEIEFNYLWGDPAAIGKRKDFKITQSFDFPTAYLFRKKISGFKNIQTKLEYEKQRKETLLKARLICTELIYYNALKLELEKRLSNAQNIANSIKTKFDSGETNVIEYNKSKLFLLTIEKELKSIELERTTLLNDLKQMNGGIPLEFTESKFEIQSVSADFDEWYLKAENDYPLMGWYQQELSVRQNSEKLSAAMNLPRFRTGYMGENVVGEKFQGITFGLSVPIMENKNRLKYAKAQTNALESIIDNNKIQYYNQLKSLHSKAIILKNELDDFEGKLAGIDNSEFLFKALETGEISQINYFMEQSVYYESIQQLLDMKKEYAITVAQMNMYMD